MHLPNVKLTKAWGHLAKAQSHILTAIKTKDTQDLNTGKDLIQETQTEINLAQAELNHLKQQTEPS